MPWFPDLYFPQTRSPTRPHAAHLAHSKQQRLLLPPLLLLNAQHQLASSSHHGRLGHAALPHTSSPAHTPAFNSFHRNLLLLLLLLVITSF
jgi:hypothetical protein